MIEAIKFWNEPNNLSHWDFGLDPDWLDFTEMIRLAAIAVRERCPDLTLVLGGISPIDPDFVYKMRERGLLDLLDVVAVHGFPLDWNLWRLDEWPQQIALIEVRDEDRGLAIGKAGKNIFKAKVLAQRQHDIADVQLMQNDSA